MASVPTMSPEVHQIMESAAERELMIVAREMERPPYWFPHEPALGNRLQRATRVVLEGRITPNSDGSYTVEGSEGRTYRVADSCSCPQSQHGKSKWCYHHVAVALYLEWHRRLPHPQPAVIVQEGTARTPEDEDQLGNGYPVDDETLPLPLPPGSVDERLAAHRPQTREERLEAYDLLAAQEPLGDDMADDASAYIPEPEEATMPTLEAPRATQALRPVQQDDDLEQALTTWTTQRRVVQRFLKQELVAGVDFYSLRIGGRDSKPSLSKAGAEKVSGWLKLQASFTPDTGTWEMLGRPQDIVCYVCTLRTRSGEIVGEGRGARSIKKDGGDVNKAMKMAEKSAFVSAVLRTGALSDCFTQDLEDMQESDPEPPAPAKAPTSQDLRRRIWAIVR